MSCVSRLVCLFKVISDINVSERLLTFEKKFTCDKSSIPALAVIEEHIHSFPTRDRVSITLSNSYDNSISIRGKGDNDNDAFSSFILESDKDDPINVLILVEKENQNGIVTVYDSVFFLEDLLSKAQTDIMRFFSRMLSQKNFLKFECQDNCDIISTKTIMFYPAGQEIEVSEHNRISNIGKCLSSSSFLNGSEYELLPEDFHFTIFPHNLMLREVFMKARMILSLCYISNSALIKDDQLKIHINGYKNNEYQLNINEFSYKENYVEFYNIYEWIFNGGNSFDKITLARQLIGIHCKYSTIFDIDGRTFSSIISNYDLYLRQNVVQYVELKNKLTEFIVATSKEIDDIAISFFDRIKNNFIAFLTFILGVLLTNVVSDNRLNNVFTKDIAMISYIILIGSVLYLIVSILEVVFRFNSYQKKYYDLKSSYQDLLDKSDIDTIFMNDKSYNENRGQIVKSTTIISAIWLLIILTIFFVIDYMSGGTITILAHILLNIWGLLASLATL